MSVTGKRGDGGWTALLSARRIRKDHPRVEACGALDELNSFLGLAGTAVRRRKVSKMLLEIQRDLFVVGSEVAASRREAARLEHRLNEEHVRRLEQHLSSLESKAQLKEHRFAIPGGCRSSALLDVCRCVARRAERRVATLKRKRMLANPLALVYLNRLSDLLFLLARSEEKRRTPPVVGP